MMFSVFVKSSYIFGIGRVGCYFCVEKKIFVSNERVHSTSRGSRPTENSRSSFKFWKDRRDSYSRGVSKGTDWWKKEVDLFLPDGKNYTADLALIIENKSFSAVLSKSEIEIFSK